MFLDMKGVAQRVTSTAVFGNAFRGFSVASSTPNCTVEILPFALDLETWTALQNNKTQDEWSYNKENGEISAGNDGVLEVNLFPEDNGAPGNRGTVDIGHGGNSTNDIKRQILFGISAADLANHGGKLEFGKDGTIILNGDTGISAAVKAELIQIKGHPRIIPIFSSVSGNGNNATYTIVKFVGVRVMEVKLTGKMDGKRVIIQPAPISTNCGIADTTNLHTYTEYVYSPVHILN